MKKYQIALSFYVEESADDLETAKTAALNKLRYKGLIHEIEAVGILAEDEWRTIELETKIGGTNE